MTPACELVAKGHDPEQAGLGQPVQKVVVFGIVGERIHAHHEPPQIETDETTRSVDDGGHVPTVASVPQHLLTEAGRMLGLPERHRPHGHAAQNDDGERAPLEALAAGSKSDRPAKIAVGLVLRSNATDGGRAR